MSVFKHDDAPVPSIRNYLLFREKMAEIGLGKKPTQVEIERAKRVASRRAIGRASRTALIVSAQAAELRHQRIAGD